MGGHGGIIARRATNSLAKHPDNQAPIMTAFLTGQTVHEGMVAMQMVIDPSLPSDVYELIVTFGYDVADARALGLADASVAQVWQRAIELERTLLTARWPSPEPPDLAGSRTPGLVIFQYPQDLDAAAIASNVIEFLQSYCQEEWRERSALVTLSYMTILPPVPRSDYVDEPGMIG